MTTNGEPIAPKIKNVGSNAKNEVSCGFIVRKSSLAIFK
jgi:hypothetical protein